MAISLAQACMFFYFVCADASVSVRVFLPRCSWQTAADDGLLTLTHFHLTRVMYFSFSTALFLQPTICKMGILVQTSAGVFLGQI